MQLKNGVKTFLLFQIRMKSNAFECDNFLRWPHDESGGGECERQRKTGPVVKRLAHRMTTSVNSPRLVEVALVVR
jgi:hypothetical protein